MLPANAHEVIADGAPGDLDVGGDGFEVVTDLPAGHLDRGADGCIEVVANDAAFGNDEILAAAQSLGSGIARDKNRRGHDR